MRRYRRNNPISKTTGVVFVLLMLVLSTAGYSYSLWSKMLTMQGKIGTAGAQLIITSDKLLIPDILGFNSTHPVCYHVASDNLTLIADCGNVTGTEWTIIIGLIVKNNGTMPIYLKDTAISFNTSASNFKVTTYYYSFDSSKWDGISFGGVPPSGDVSPPIQLDLNDRAITWTVIQLTTATSDTRIIATPELQPFP
jgi:hypothetical protein